jgi:hypothetical protein
MSGNPTFIRQNSQKTRHFASILPVWRVPNGAARPSKEVKIVKKPPSKGSSMISKTQIELAGFFSDEKTEALAEARDQPEGPEQSLGNVAPESDPSFDLEDSPDDDSAPPATEVPVLTGDREPDPVAKRPRKRRHGVRVDHTGRATCRACDQAGEIAHHRSEHFWSYWTRDRLAAVLEQVRFGESLAWIAYRSVLLTAPDRTERVLYECGGLWSAELQLDATSDDEPDPLATVVVGPLPNIPRKDRQKNLGFIVNFDDQIVCRRCGERGQHDLTLLFWTSWKREQLAALVQAMQADEHLVGIAHKVVKLEAADGSRRTLHENAGAWREESAEPDSPDPSLGPSDPEPRSQSDQSPQKPPKSAPRRPGAYRILARASRPRAPPAHRDPRQGSTARHQ